MKNLSFGDTVELQNLMSEGGNLSIFDTIRFRNFDIRRIYFLHDIPLRAERGGHAHLRLTQFFIAVNGSFTIDLINNGESKQLIANSPTQAIYVPPVTWRVLRNFTDDAICLVLASESFDEADYVRDYEEFVKLGQA